MTYLGMDLGGEERLEELSILSLSLIANYPWHTVPAVGSFLLLGPHPSLGALTKPCGAGESHPLQHLSTVLGTCV